VAKVNRQAVETSVDRDSNLGLHQYPTNLISLIAENREIDATILIYALFSPATVSPYTVRDYSD